MGDSSDGLPNPLDPNLNFSADGAQSLELQEFMKLNGKENPTSSTVENDDKITFNCIPCNRSFDTSKGLKIHESFHVKLRGKIESKKSNRKRNINIQKVSRIERNKSSEDLTELDEFLLMNQNEIEIQLNNDLPSPSQFQRIFLKTNTG